MTVQTVRVRDIDHAVDIFLGECARRGFTPASIEKYRYLLYKYAEFIGKDLALHEITPMHCREFLDQWQRASVSTMALHVTILSRFFEFLFDEEIIEVSPMARIRRPKLQRAEALDVTTVSGSDVEKLWQAAREWDEMLCLAVLSYLGPRRTAAANLRLRDIDFEHDPPTVRFKEKGGKVITKPMPHELAQILLSAAEAGVWQEASDYVIPNRRAPRGKTRSAKVIYAIVKRLAERAGIDVHPHALRAAFAVRYLESHPGDMEALQELMGHERPETTRVYLRRHDKFKAMERVVDLSWGFSALPSSADMPPAGFEPAFREDALPEHLRLKLSTLRARSESKDRR